MDAMSRAVVARFLFKPPMAALLASLLNGPFLTFVSAFLVLYATVAVVGALLLRQRVFTRSFTLWDEASWLACLALGLDLAG